MLVVIADTSPIRYLIQIGHIDLLRRLFGAVYIPAEVARELADASAPPAVQDWIKAPPVWLSVEEVSRNDDPELSNLDPGERASIAIGADLVLIDERRGYNAAVRLGLEATGTLGILDLAAKGKLIDLRIAIERLKQTNFRYRREIIEGLLAQHKDRQASRSASTLSPSGSPPIRKWSSNGVLSRINKDRRAAAMPLMHHLAAPSQQRRIRCGSKDRTV